MLLGAMELSGTLPLKIALFGLALAFWIGLLLVDMALRRRRVPRSWLLGVEVLFLVSILAVMFSSRYVHVTGRVGSLSSGEDDDYASKD